MLKPDSTDAALREHLAELLEGGNAHIPFADAVKAFPIAIAGNRPKGSPHTAWELLEHLRIAVEDIVRFSGVYETRPRGTGDASPPKHYNELAWPDDYWPSSSAPGNAKEWKQSIAAVERAVADFVAYLKDKEHDLFTPFAWGNGQTLLREALLIADHNAYHLGQLVLLRRMLE